MEYFLQQLINGITLGSIYGLIAIGYTMVYGIIGMINFAHGEVFMIGAFIALTSFLALAALGIVRGTQFTATLGQERISALLGSDYNDVPRGDWVALIERDERDSTRTYLQLAISFGNAATEIGCAVGDTLYIEQP